MPQTATQLLVNASDAGLHITGLDGWTQTRLAKTLQIRRETLNAIINRSPGSEPTDERPRMIEACRKLITFAAALSSKDDAVLKNPIDVANLQSDDGQAYEHHRLRLHRLVEEAVQSNQFTNALCRIGEFASTAMHAAEAYRLRMICNLVTAIQRLLDKPSSREVSTAVLRANLVRLYRAERTARRIGRDRQSDPSIQEQLHYVRGQAGYALIFSGILLMQPRLIRRGGERLFHAIAVQPAEDCGHWSNLLRAVNDLLAGNPVDAQKWAGRIIAIAKAQTGDGFATAYHTLQSKGEIQRLRTHWSQSEDKTAVDRLLQSAPSKDPPNRGCTFKQAVHGAVAALVLTWAAWATVPAFAGDGRDFKSSQTDPANTPRVQTPPAQGSTPTPARPQTATASGSTPKDARPVVRLRGVGRFRIDESDSDAKSNREIDRGNADLAIASNESDLALAGNRLAQALDDAWGDNIKAYPRVTGGSAKIIVVPKPMPERNPETAIDRPAPRPTPISTDPVDKAARALDMAKNYLSTGDESIARRKLKEIVKSYPETPAAQQAQTMLQQLAAN